MKLPQKKIIYTDGQRYFFFQKKENKMYARCTRISRERLQSNNSARMNKSNFITEKIV